MGGIVHGLWAATYILMVCPSGLSPVSLWAAEQQSKGLP